MGRRGRKYAKDAAPNPDGTKTQEQQPKRPPLSLRFVIGLMTAAIVLVVGGTVFAITYTQSLSSVDKVAKNYAKSLLKTAVLQVETTFQMPATLLKTMSEMIRQEGIVMPNNDSTTWGVLDQIKEYEVNLFLAMYGQLATTGIIFDDGSSATIADLGNGDVYVHLTNAITLNISTRSLYKGYVYNVKTMKRVNWPTPRLPVEDARFAIYHQIAPLLRGNPLGLWNTPSYADIFDPPADVLPAVMPLHMNDGTFLGISTATVKMDVIEGYLRKLQTTPNTVTFAIDTLSALIATTHAAGATHLRTLRKTTSKAEAEVQTGACSSTVIIAPADATQWTISCRTLSKDFPYAPLRDSVGDLDFIKPSVSDGIVLKSLAVGGSTYFAASARIDNTFAGMPIVLIAFIPEDDVLGEVVQARNVAIIIVCVVLVVATGLSFALVSAVLAPLTRVASKMRRTARLRDVANEDRLSPMAEIYDLQAAFGNMNNAIKSFTRYVPRDVVKDLLASGQLCTIQMATMRCSMLFVDIAGFTTLCERIPVDELSALVRTYFEQMSTIVMTHGGLIDKFIGDCIMAVWGAPFQVANQEAKATLCGLLIDRETREDPLACDFDAAGERLHVRVGIATGDVLAGNMGSAERMSYTVIGDDVNLAARLESLNKQFGTRVMIAEATKRQLPSIYVTRLLHRIQVVGKDQPIEVFEVLGLSTAQLGGDVAQELRALEGEDSTETNSMISMLSAMSANNANVAPEADEKRVAALPLPQLLEKAAHFRTGSIVVEAEARVVAETCTRAVNMYLAEHFAEAISILDTLPKNTSESDIAASVLRTQCEEALKDRTTFTGCWKAGEK